MEHNGDIQGRDLVAWKVDKSREAYWKRSLCLRVEISQTKAVRNTMFRRRGQLR